MAEARVIIQLEDENLNLVDGVVHLINKTTLNIAHRGETSNGQAVFIVDDTVDYIVTILSADYYGTNKELVNVVHNAIYGVGVVTKTVASPSNGNMCVVTAKALNPLGKPVDAMYIKASLMSGKIADGEDVIFNSTSFIKPDKDGYVQFELYKNRKYQLLINSGNELGQQELFTVYVPDKTHINLADILFPKITSIVFNENVDASGDYDLSLVLSNGQTETSYSEIINLLSISVSDVDAEVRKKDDADTAILRVGATNNGYIDLFRIVPGFNYPEGGWGNREDSGSRSLIQRIQF